MPVLSYESARRRAGRRLRMADASTSARPRFSATRRARPAIRRARCTRIARRCCTRTARRCPMRWARRRSDAILPVVPMFHVNAWGIPHAAPLVGAKLVFPGKDLDGKSLYELIEAEGVTYSAGVPTVWLGLLTYMKQAGRALLDVQAHGDRRLGVSARDAAHLRGRLRRRGDPRVGHDGDVAARHARAAELASRSSARPRSSATRARSRATRSSAST